MDQILRTACTVAALSFVSYKSLPQSTALPGGNTTLSGHLSGIPDGNYIYLTTYPLDSGTIYHDSAQVKKGMFSLQLSIPEGEGSLYYLSSVPMIFTGDKSPIQPILFTGRWQTIYLQPGRAIVNGDANHLDSAAYTGDPYMQEENDYFIQQRSNSAWERTKKRNAEAYARGENMNVSHPVKEDSAGNDLVTGMVQRGQIARKWIQQHLNSPYSSVVIYNDISGLFDSQNEERAKFFRQLTPAARNNKLGKKLALWLQ